MTETRKHSWQSFKLRSWQLAALGVAVLMALMAGIASADTNTINFETYSLGTVDGQDGWVSTGSVGGGCAMYDVEVDSSFGYGTFGTKSLRISNAATSGCFTDQTYSKSLVDEAGEAAAVNGGFSGGTRQSHFEAAWDFASTVPGAEQPGLQVVASPDRGDGARMSYIRMTDKPSGLGVDFIDYQSGVNVVGCGDNFVETNAVSGLDRTVPHTIKVTMDFKPGPGPAYADDVKVYVDGVLKINKRTSWEDYFRECQDGTTRTVDSLLFRVAGTNAPATAGNGFVIDNLTLTSRASQAGDAKPTNTPTATPTPQGPVGGISLDPGVGGSSGSDAWLLLTAGLAVITASALALGGGAWYVRRRRVQ